ncbi:MAG: NAD(P)/FAD-dependent oxidoreductase [Nocardioidaceae bacterium]
MGRPLIRSTDYQRLSLWHDTADDDWAARPALPGPLDVDVAIVGAGYTGLWTACYLSRVAPDCRIVVLEREVAGFGASGRNGGWCSALFPTASSVLARRHGAAAAVRMARAMRDSVVGVGDAAADESIDAHYDRGGTVVLARSDVQLRRARAAVEEANRLGTDELELLDAGSARGHLAATDVVGGTYTPHCAALHPARLVRGLARAVERRGVTIYENTPARSVAAGTVETAAGRVRADVVVRATEGYTASLAGQRRRLAPVYSLMVATEPLPVDFWSATGLEQRQTFTDGRHLIVYGQRTRDGRIAFGGRGAPYHFGSSVRPEHDHEPAVFAALRATLRELLPALHEARFTHAWGGVLGVPRDWHASVGLDRGSGVAWAGGYVGDGVGASHLAGQTLADLIAERQSELVTLPWVGHVSPSWEPEPLRWLGVNAGLRAMTLADAEEARTSRPSLLARAMAPLTGGHSPAATERSRY